MLWPTRRGRTQAGTEVDPAGTEVAATGDGGQSCYGEEREIPRRRFRLVRISVCVVARLRRGRAVDDHDITNPGRQTRHGSRRAEGPDGSCALHRVAVQRIA